MKERTTTRALACRPNGPSRQAPARPGGRFLPVVLGSTVALFEVGIVGLYFYGVRPDIFWGGKEDFPSWVLPLASALVGALLATAACGFCRKLEFEDLIGALGVRCALTSFLPAVIGGVARRDVGDGLHFLWAGFVVLTVFGLPGWIAGTASVQAVRSLLTCRNRIP